MCRIARYTIGNYPHCRNIHNQIDGGAFAFSSSPRLMTLYTSCKRGQNRDVTQIKIVRSDRGGEYYGRYTEDGQAPRPFAKFLQEHGIVSQYTMPNSPDQNGVAERRNRTLLDMV